MAFEGPISVDDDSRSAEVTGAHSASTAIRGRATTSKTAFMVMLLLLFLFFWRPPAEDWSGPEAGEAFSRAREGGRRGPRALVKERIRKR